MIREKSFVTHDFSLRGGACNTADHVNIWEQTAFHTFVVDQHCYRYFVSETPCDNMSLTCFEYFEGEYGQSNLPSPGIRVQLL